MTREELRAKAVELEETVDLAEAEIEKLRPHVEYIWAIEMGGEELLERYAKLIPNELENLSPAELQQIYQRLEVTF